MATPAAMAPASPPPSATAEPAPGVLWLPSVFQPGVANHTHLVLQVILLALNAFLGYCAVVGVNRPHYEIMFLLSLGLTGSYVWYVAALRGAPAEAGGCPSAASRPAPGHATRPSTALANCATDIRRPRRRARSACGERPPSLVCPHAPALLSSVSTFAGPLWRSA
ncbi:hypothetical protein BU14_2915s0001, partial [Porphyra umbilicalis]